MIRGTHRPWRYAVATLAVTLTIALLRIPGLEDGFAGLLFFTILLSAWYGGAGPGVAATALIIAVVVGAALAASTPMPKAQIWSLIILMALGTLISVIVENLLVAKRRAIRGERWVSTVLKSIGDAVIATDERGRVIFVNPIAATLTGWTEAEARDKNLEEIFHIINEETRQPVENPVARVFATGQVVGLANHTVLIARDGRETCIDDSAAPIIDDRGQILGVVLAFRDVTVQRRADELREHMAAIVESTDDAVISKDLNGVITSWNPGAERLLGYSAAEVVGQHVSILIPPDHAEDVATILDQIRRGEKVRHYETRRRRKDGTSIDVQLTVSPIRDSAGRIIGASKTGRDITERKQMELERLDADRRKDEFLAMLAHELRNPLASINNAVHLLGRPEAEDQSEWARDVVLRQVGHLARLIDDLLDVSRITRGKISLRTEPLDLSPIVSHAVEAVRPLIQERKHELDVALPDASLRLEADPLRLEQILVNLLTNAAKYTEAGGRIRLAANHERDEIVITVRDTGIGIPPEVLPRMFDLFAQGDRSIARSEGGLGIGLTLVKRLAEMHGGSVTGVSEGLGRGSEFTVRLPASSETTTASPEAKAPEVKAPAPQPARARSRVLVVDDNIDTAKGLARLLKLLGHDVKVAHDGTAALEVARDHRPEIVLLDIGLPGMDGYQVVRRLRADGFCDASLIIAASGYGQDEDRRRAQEAGFDHHLVKPINYDHLMSLLAGAS